MGKPEVILSVSDSKWTRWVQAKAILASGPWRGPSTTGGSRSSRGSNGSAGTDHGTAGPVFVAGAAGRLSAGLLGLTPRLDPSHLVDGDLAWSVDFREVYAAVLAQWLGLDPAPVLGAGFHPIPLFRPA